MTGVKAPSRASWQGCPHGVAGSTKLLTLLHLGIRNIRLGPTLPAFVTPTVLKALNEQFNLMPIKTAEQDLNAILESAA